MACANVLTQILMNRPVFAAALTVNRGVRASGVESLEALAGRAEALVV